jgi:hypothetical protein
MARLFSQLAPATLAVYGGPVLPELLGDDESFRIETERVLHQQAAHGAIILGYRAHPARLRRRPPLLHLPQADGSDPIEPEPSQQR